MLCVLLFQLAADTGKIFTNLNSQLPLENSVSPDVAMRACPFQHRKVEAGRPWLCSVSRLLTTLPHKTKIQTKRERVGVVFIVA